MLSNDVIGNVSAIILSISAIFGVVTYFRTSKKNRASTAMTLVKYYMERILPLCSFVINCIKNDEFLNEIMYKLDQHETLYFFEEEMTEIFSEDEIQRYNNLFKNISIDTIKEVYLPNQFQLDSLDGAYNTLLETIKSSQSDDYTNKTIIDCLFVRLVARIKNELEYFSMSFLSVGDIKLVYSSIHQTYLRYCKIFYLNCSQYNKYNHEKFYTNMIRLYNRWNKKTKWSKKIADNKRVRVQKWLNKQK